METRIRNIQPEMWHKFKILCAVENVSVNSKLLELVREAVESTDEENRQLSQALSKGLKKAGSTK